MIANPPGRLAGDFMERLAGDFMGCLTGFKSAGTPGGDEIR